jgi:hypothetical protein
MGHWHNKQDEDSMKTLTMALLAAAALVWGSPVSAQPAGKSEVAVRAASAELTDISAKRRAGRNDRAIAERKGARRK